MTTAREAMLAMRRAFEAAGLETPDLDARFLMQDALALDGAALLANPDRPVGSAAAAIMDMTRRRLAREPVSRILGWREFYGRCFVITPDVLDPRPETETLIDLALEIGRERGWDTRPIRFVDIGAGSGAIVLTLLAEWPMARAVATDVSAAALAVTRRNAVTLGVSERLETRRGRSFAGVVGEFDLVVSNPPYIDRGDLDGLAPEVRLHDPALALDGGGDGLEIYREIAADLSRLTSPVQIALEVGARQAAAVSALFAAVGGGQIRIARDLAGVSRVVALEIHR